MVVWTGIIQATRGVHVPTFLRLEHFSTKISFPEQCWLRDLSFLEASDLKKLKPYNEKVIYLHLLATEIAVLFV